MRHSGKIGKKAVTSDSPSFALSVATERHDRAESRGSAFGRLVAKLQPFAGMRHLDVAGGTGDVAFRVLKAIRMAEADAALTSSAVPQARLPTRLAQAHGYSVHSCLLIERLRISQISCTVRPSFYGCCCKPSLPSWVMLG